jgi:DNA-binding transcriptional ArsR family regulator
MASRVGNRRVSADDRLDAVFSALGDRTRRALLARLAQAPARITELAKPFAISLPAVSRHVRVLEAAGLVMRAVDGRVHECSLDPLPLKSAEDWLCSYRRFWHANLESLARYVER